MERLKTITKQQSDWIINHGWPIMDWQIATERDSNMKWQSNTTIRWSSSSNHKAYQSIRSICLLRMNPTSSKPNSRSVFASTRMNPMKSLWRVWIDWGRGRNHLKSTTTLHLINSNLMNRLKNSIELVPCIPNKKKMCSYQKHQKYNKTRRKM